MPGFTTFTGFSGTNVLFQDDLTRAVVLGSFVPNDPGLFLSNQIAVVATDPSSLASTGTLRIVEILGTGTVSARFVPGAVAPVPEPSSWALLGAGMLLTGWARYRRARR